MMKFTESANLANQSRRWTMSDTHHAGRNAPVEERQSCFSSRFNIALLIFLAIGAFYLITEHGAHLFGILPWLLLLACGLLHQWMHSGHSGRDAQSGSPPGERGAHRH